MIGKGTSQSWHCFSYMFSLCPAGPRSLTRPGRLRWQTHRRACQSPSSPGRSWSRHCPGWPDEENTYTERGRVKTVAATKCRKNIPASGSKCLHFPCSLCLHWPLRSTKAVTVETINEYLHKRFLLTYWKLFSPILLQPTRYRATSGAPCSQVALKLVWVTSENCKFFGAGTTSTEQRKGRSVWSLPQHSKVSSWSAKFPFLPVIASPNIGWPDPPS